MSECIFCKIINKEIPSQIVYEDEYVCAFNDIEPQAPIHIVVIPKKHIASLNDIDAEEMNLVEKIFTAVQTIVKEKEISQKGYRIVTNCGKDGGQTVDHIHFHLLGGRQLLWPPG